MNTKNKKNIVIAGGGTGGHIYPGIAIAKALQKMDPHVQVHFVGTPYGLENKIVPREGFPLHLISVGKLNIGDGPLFQRLIGIIKTLLGLPIAFIKCFILILKLKPQIVLGVGGYASGPFVLIASLSSKFLPFICPCQTMIWEPNAFPGMTNRWLSRFVDKCFVVFKEAETFLKSQKIKQVGLPVRKELESLGQKNFSKELPNEISEDDSKNHQKDSFNILLFGGSQGARALNKALSEAIASIRSIENSWIKNVKIFHQTGSLDFELIAKKYKELDPAIQAQVEVQPFIYDMDKKYAWADLVICRAGASTVAELASCGMPAILIPLPSAADDHQKKNALALVEKQACILLEQKDLKPEKLIQLIERLITNPQELKMMKSQIQLFFVPKAAETIAHEMIY